MTDNGIIRRAQFENVVTLVCTAAIVLGLYGMGAGNWSFVGFVLLLNINSVKHRTEKNS